MEILFPNINEGINCKCPAVAVPLDPLASYLYTAWKKSHLQAAKAYLWLDSFFAQYYFPNHRSMIIRSSLILKCSFLLKKKDFMALFHGWGSTASRLEPLWGGSLLFIIKFPKIAGTYFLSPSEGQTILIPKSDPKKEVPVLI